MGGDTFILYHGDRNMGYVYFLGYFVERKVDPAVFCRLFYRTDWKQHFLFHLNYSLLFCRYLLLLTENVLASKDKLYA